MERAGRPCTSPASYDLLLKSSVEQVCSKSAVGNACQAPPTPSTVTRAKLTLEHLGTCAYNASSELRAALLINKSSGK